MRPCLRSPPLASPFSLAMRVRIRLADPLWASRATSPEIGPTVADGEGAVGSGRHLARTILRDIALSDRLQGLGSGSGAHPIVADGVPCVAARRALNWLGQGTERRSEDAPHQRGQRCKGWYLGGHGTSPGVALGPGRTRPGWSIGVSRRCRRRNRWVTGLA